MDEKYRRYPPWYVAVGFYEDANQLLKQFTAQKSLKFSCFACVWRDFRFSSIFMGRETLRELTEFIDECYRNALQFIDESDRFMKVGAIYLLYSLYLKQPSHLLIRPVQILLSIRQLQEIYQLEHHFLEERTADALHFSFIIAKLFKMEAVRISCFPIPMGPAVPMNLFRVVPLRNSCFKEAVGAARMLNDQDLKNIRETAKELHTLRKTLPNHAHVFELEDVNKLCDIEEYILQLEKCYNAGITLTKEDNNIKKKAEMVDLREKNTFSISQHSQKCEEIKPPNLTGRRALLDQQFEKSAEDRLFRKTCQTTDSSSEISPPSTPVKRKRGKPKLARIRWWNDRRRGKKITNKADQETDSEDIDNICGAPPIPSTFTETLRKPMPPRKHYFEDEDY